MPNLIVCNLFVTIFYYVNSLVYFRQFFFFSCDKVLEKDDELSAIGYITQFFWAFYSFVQLFYLHKQPMFGRFLSFHIFVSEVRDYFYKNMNGVIFSSMTKVLFPNIVGFRCYYLMLPQCLSPAMVLMGSVGPPQKVLFWNSSGIAA